METQNDTLYKIADLRQETEIDQETIKNEGEGHNGQQEDRDHHRPTLGRG